MTTPRDEREFNLRGAVNEVADHIERAGGELAQQIEVASRHFAFQMGDAARDLDIAKTRIRRSLRRIEHATLEFTESTRKPRARWRVTVEDAWFDFTDALRRLWDRLAA